MLFVVAAIIKKTLSSSIWLRGVTKEPSKDVPVTYAYSPHQKPVVDFLLTIIITDLSFPYGYSVSKTNDLYKFVVAFEDPWACLSKILA